MIIAVINFIKQKRRIAKEISTAAKARNKETDKPPDYQDVMKMKKKQEEENPPSYLEALQLEHSSSSVINIYS